MLINTTLEFKQALRAGPYAWPGGYPTYFVCDDGGSLCPACAKREARLIMRAIVDHRRFGRGGYQADWRVIGADINYEDDMLWCEHCNEQIESAYGN